MTLTMDFQMDVKFGKNCISRIGRLIDMGWKGWESIGCLTKYVTLSYEIGLPRSKFEMSVSQQLVGQLKGMWVSTLLDPLCDLDLWPHPWPWTWIFKVKFSYSHISQDWEDRLTWNEKDIVYNVAPLCNLALWQQRWLHIEFLDFRGQILS